MNTKREKIINIVILIFGILLTASGLAVYQEELTHLGALALWFDLLVGPTFIVVSAWSLWVTS